MMQYDEFFELLIKYRNLWRDPDHSGRRARELRHKLLSVFCYQQAEIARLQEEVDRLTAVCKNEGTDV